MKTGVKFRTDRWAEDFVKMMESTFNLGGKDWDKKPENIVGKDFFEDHRISYIRL